MTETTFITPEEMAQLKYFEEERKQLDAMREENSTFISEEANEIYKKLEELFKRLNSEENNSNLIEDIHEGITNLFNISRRIESEIEKLIAELDEINNMAEKAVKWLENYVMVNIAVD